MKKQAKFGVGIGVILVALGFLAWLGYGESKTYYHTIAELQTLNSSQRSQRVRVGGTVAQGSIRHFSGRVDFVLEGEGKALPVSYGGSDPLPDTFVDKSQALVEGHLGSDGCAPCMPSWGASRPSSRGIRSWLRARVRQEWRPAA